MAKKGNRIQVIMECTEHKATGKPGTSRYITTKNRKNTPERLEIKKYNPILRKQTMNLKCLLAFFFCCVFLGERSITGDSVRWTFIWDQNKTFKT